MNSGAPAKQANCNEVVSASIKQQESPAGSSKPLRKMSSDETRAERIARYKEERKKQLQARFGGAVVGGKKDDSSSSEEHQEEHSYTKYRLRKQQQKENISNNSANISGRNETETNEKTSNSDKAASPGTAIRRFIRRESPLSEEAPSPGLVRTNRAARLRAAAAATTTPQSDSKQETQARTKRPSLSGRKDNASPTDLVIPAAGAGSSEGLCPEGASGTKASQEVVLRRKLSSQNDKDKSTKRKSNLNRAVTEEQVTSTGDTIEDPAKRGRRRPRGVDVAASYSSADTDPTSSVDSLINRKDVRETEKQTTALEMPVGKHESTTSTDSSDKPVRLRSNLRESVPAFLSRRSPSRNELSKGVDANAKLPASIEKKPFQASKLNAENKLTAGYPSVPWRTTGKAALTPSVKAEDITARIEALTAMAKQTVARVDRLTSNGKSVTTPDNTLQKATHKNDEVQSVKADSVKTVVAANDQASLAKTHSILKNKAAVETGTESRPKSPEILKPAVRIRTESGSRAESPEPMSILKRKISKEELSFDKVSGEPQSILKRRPSRDEGTTSRSISPEPHSILKRKTKIEASLPETETVEPRPILKKRSSTEDGAEPRPILKKKSSTDDEHDGDKPKPILKSPRRRSPELAVNSDSESLRILRRRAVAAEEQTISLTERINHVDRTTVRAPEAPTPNREAPWRQPAKATGASVDSSLEDTKADPTDNKPSLPIADTGAIPKLRKSADSHRSEDTCAEVAPAPASQVQINEAVNTHVHFSQDIQEPKANEQVELGQEHGCLMDAEVKSTSSPPERPSRSRSTTQPVTLEEVHEASKMTLPGAGEQEVAEQKDPEQDSGARNKELSVVDIQHEASDTESKGIDRIRGILRKKSTESVTEIKGILRSKSPAQKEEAINGAPKPILKRQSDFFQSGASSSSSVEDVTVPPDRNLATKLLTVEAEAKAQQHESEVKQTVEISREDESSSSLSFTTPPPPEAAVEPVSQDIAQAGNAPCIADEADNSTKECNIASSSEQSVAMVSESVSTQKVTIIHQSSGERSEEDNSGTETSTTVILRLASTSVTKTQSETKMWKKKETSSSTLVEQKSSIASRLAALQKSGDSEWRKRLSKIKTDDPEQEVKQAAVISDESASSIADRLSLLTTAQKGWKKRVEETDAIKFTVAGKMGRGSSFEEVPSGSAPSSPLMDRKKKTPKPVKYRSKVLDEGNDSKSSPVTPSDEGHAPFLRSTSEPNGKADGRSESRPVSRVVAVPRPDDETFTSFFASTTTISSSVTTTVSGIIDGDLDAIIAPTEDLMIQRKSVRIQKRKFASRNPIKSLTARTDLQEEYEEVDTGVAERELRRLKLEQLAKNSNLAVEALAGLASKEDFTAVTLKTAQNPTTSAVYLIHIKGRRHVQSRLVEPVVTSVNSGDAYVLVTPTEVFQWMGQYSNVIERAKCADVAQQILAKKNLGCAQATQVTIIDEDKVGSGAYGASKRFWKALGAEDGKQKRVCGPPEEDEIYEAAIIETNMVWSLEGEELVPVDGYWGGLPKTDMLLPQKVYVFDFGSEMYVWSGKQAPFEARKKAMHLAKELWDEGYDYTECEVNPLDPAGLAATSKSSKQRPTWSLFSKANQHMEPVLFREKFLDWPDTSRLIKVKSQENDEKGRTNVDTNTLVAFDARLMLDNVLSDPSLELEGAQVGRGVEYYDAAEKRLSEIVTLSVKTWHILEYDKLLLPETSFGQFHSCDTYIVRWQYRITVTGRDLKGQASKHGVLGRDRCCYFFWHGRDAPPTEQGASALNTIDLDSERGPHVRVVQGRESPAFLALFKGRMIVHKGKRQEDPTSANNPWRMYMVRGERENEACLVEVDKGGQALRSRGSYLVVNRSTGIVYVWHGGKSQKHTRQITSSVANLLKAHKPSELQIKSAKVTVKELYEGAETKDFWEGLGENSRNSHFSLLNSKQRFDHTLRMFHLTSWTGQFKAEEVACPIRLPQVTSSYPFLQSDLYEANQPALFLIDNQHEVWLWQGWWPVNLDDNDNTRTGSGKLRWTAERKCAYETTLHYCQLKNPQNRPEAFLVSAGLEPLEFKCLFPEWVDDKDIAELNIQEGRNPGEKLLVREVLDRLTRTTYTLEELQAKPPPEGVDPTKLESYLTDTAFQEAMKMTKDEFYGLPSWKQTALRKEVGLF